MTYAYTIKDDEMTQDVFDAETMLLNKIDARGYRDYNSIRLFDNKGNEVNLTDLKLVVYKENNHE